MIICNNVNNHNNVVTYVKKTNISLSCLIIWESYPMDESGASLSSSKMIELYAIIILETRDNSGMA